MPVETLQDMPDTCFWSGLTAEGLPFEFVAFFDNPLDKTRPSYVGGWFSSRDGGGTFDIDQLPDGMYRNTWSGRIGRRPEDVMPWVVAEGEW